MRRITTLFALVSMTACAIPRESHIDPAGPYPDARIGTVVREISENGVLVVFTSTVRVDLEGRLYHLPNDLNWNSSHSVHTGYSIYDPSGRLVREVPNHTPLIVSDEGPTEVALPAGDYLVRLDRIEGEHRAFWVTIDAGRRTEVDPARFVLDWPGRVVGPKLR
ncbi:MAG TPA: hypothetical protein VMU54_09260 [Planctomycetota bacterium]|nr:hypothetical protein [Planctomycetota bacterium]